MELTQTLSRSRDRSLARLSWRRIDSLTVPGDYEDGGGLRPRVSKNRTKSWVIRVTLNGKRTTRGLGPYERKSMGAVRERAAQIRQAARHDIDLVQQEENEQRARAASIETVRETFELLWTNKKQRLSNGKHQKQWLSTLEQYVFPHIGDTPVAEVTPREILAILQPIWHEKPETAGRVLQRMRAIFDAAIFRQVRTKADPTTGVSSALGPLRRDVQHHDALPYEDVPAFITDLRAGPAKPITRLALEFLVLTAVRSGEVRGAVWSEIDLEAKLWSIPGKRMKGGKDHAVPLSKRAIEILVQARRAGGGVGELIFPSPRGKPLSDNNLSKVMRDMQAEGTPHGFRSSFKDWSAEQSVRDEVSEAALAHVDSNKVRAAYRRTNHLDERVEVMEHWAKHCQGKE